MTATKLRDSASRKVSKLEAELSALAESHKHCQAAVLTKYLELGSRMRVCDPHNGQAAMNFFKKPLEVNAEDWDALELAGRQALAMGLNHQAVEFLERLVDATKGHDVLRHARASRFHSEVLHEGTPNDNAAARSNLESAITFLQEHTDSDIDPAERKEELGLAYEMLAKVLIRIPRYRLARNAIAEAKRHLGNLERLKELEERAKPKG